MPLDLSGAQAQNDFSELIPNGTLCWGVFRVRPYNYDAGIIETPSKSSSAHYLDCEVTIEGGDYDKRKVWTRIGTQGTEKYVNMGSSALKAIVETGCGAGPQNPNGYYIPDLPNGQPNYMALDGLKIAFKVKEEAGRDGYPPKNDVAVFLSPVQPNTEKDWNRLLAGETAPSEGARRAAAAPSQGGQRAAPQQPAARWGGGSGGAPQGQGQAPAAQQPAPQAQQPLVNPNQAPSWLGAPQQLAPQSPASAPAAQGAPQANPQQGGAAPAAAAPSTMPMGSAGTQPASSIPTTGCPSNGGPPWGGAAA